MHGLWFICLSWKNWETANRVLKLAVDGQVRQMKTKALMESSIVERIGRKNSQFILMIWTIICNDYTFFLHTVLCIVLFSLYYSYRFFVIESYYSWFLLNKNIYIYMNIYTYPFHTWRLNPHTLKCECEFVKMFFLTDIRK